MYSSNSHISLNYMYQSINNVPINQSNANLTFTVYVYPFILVYYLNILEPRLEPL